MRRLPSSTLLPASERHFEAWVRGRLSSWTAREIQALDRWLLAESLDEFVPAVRTALSYRQLEEPADAAPDEWAI